jgi:hypothetical protein
MSEVRVVFRVRPRFWKFWLLLDLTRKIAPTIVAAYARYFRAAR